jgi:hypothetical protein
MMTVRHVDDLHPRLALPTDGGNNGILRPPLHGAASGFSREYPVKNREFTGSEYASGIISTAKTGNPFTLQQIMNGTLPHAFGGQSFGRLSQNATRRAACDIANSAVP